MNQKIKGILTVFGILIALIILAFIVGGVVSSTSSDPWAGLGAILMVFFGIGLALLILLITGLYLYFKKESNYGLGLLQGLGMFIAISFILSIIVRILNV